MATERSRVVRNAQARASGRTSSSRSGRRPAATPPSNTPIIMGLAAGGLALVIILVMMTWSGGNSEAANTGDGEKQKPAPAKAQQPEAPKKTTQSPSNSSYAARPGKTPGRPAPPIPASVIERTEQLFADAKAKWNEGQRARKSGDTATYTKAIKEAYESIQGINKALDPYSTWYEEADLEGWAMPGEYVGLSKKFNKYDKLAAMVQKVKQR